MNWGLLNKSAMGGSVMRRGGTSNARARNNYWMNTGLQPISIAPTFQWRPGKEPTPPIMTATRASTATRINESKLIEQVAANIVRIDYDPITGECLGALCEEARTNLLTYSENFDNAAWTKTRATITPNAAVAPDGTMTADKLVEDTTATNSHYITYSSVVTGTGARTATVFAYAGERSSIQFDHTGNTGSAGRRLTYNITTGVLGASTIGSGGLSAYEESAVRCGNGWVRIISSITPTVTTGGTGTVSIATNNGSTTSYSGDGTSGLYIWGAQLEAGAFPTSYIPSSVSFTSRASTATYVGSDGLIKSAAIDAARMNYNPTNLIVAPKLLVEAASTNLLTKSEEFQDSAWTKTRSSITPNVVLAPDGTYSADMLVEDSTATSTHQISTSAVVTTGTKYTKTVYAKASTRSVIAMLFGSGAFSTTPTAWFDLSSGIVSSTSGSPEASITSVGNGWYRCSMTATATASTTGYFYTLLSVATSGSASYTGNGTSGLYIWGAQLESGTLSSYIPTTTAAVTRAADVSSSAAATRAADVWTVPVSSFAFNKDEGTVYCSADSMQPSNINKSGYGAILHLDNTHYLAAMDVGWQNSFGGYGYNGVAISLLGTGYLPNTKYNNAVAYKAGDYSSVVGGGTPVKASTGGALTVPSFATLYIGAFTGGTINGHIRHIAYFPRRISDSNLQLLTA